MCRSVSVLKSDRRNRYPDTPTLFFLSRFFREVWSRIKEEVTGPLGPPEVIWTVTSMPGMMKTLIS